MISLHDYSKSKETDVDVLPTLLNNIDEKFEIVYIKPQEITIFQVGILYK